MSTLAEQLRQANVYPRKIQGEAVFCSQRDHREVIPLWVDSLVIVKTWDSTGEWQAGATAGNQVAEYNTIDEVWVTPTST